jgi:hypothetical protein
MIVGIQASKEFYEYKTFLRAMYVILSDLEDDQELVFYSAGPSKLNSMAMEFTNITERSLKAQGVRIRMHKVSPQWLSDNLHEIDQFLYFCLPKEPGSALYRAAEAKDLQPYIYNFY